jgi:asparagine synthetase B (glutamine-hydrolysing)
MCGIFGMVSKRTKSFNKRAFCTMGVRNDTRGGDSCGVFIDGLVEYGVDKQKTFMSFFRNSILLETTSECKIALGHCRKASVGKVSLETAQPVVLYNEEGAIDYVLIHNGTIYNYKELAQKYIPDIDIEGLTDSQVMARIFYHKGYDALDEYYGGAVFVIHDYRVDQTLVFKGASSKTNYAKVIRKSVLCIIVGTMVVLYFLQSLKLYTLSIMRRLYMNSQ